MEPMQSTETNITLQLGSLKLGETKTLTCCGKIRALSRRCKCVIGVLFFAVFASITIGAIFGIKGEILIGDIIISL